MRSAERSWVEISAPAIRANFLQFKRTVPATVDVLPIVKADGYGHGVQNVVHALRGLANQGVGVAHGDEALALRRSGYRGRLIVLSTWQPNELLACLTNNIELVVSNFDELNLLRRACQPVRSKRVHIKIDTGTSRIGFLPGDLGRLRDWKIDRFLRVVGIFSHLANAEEAHAKRTHSQIQRFATLVLSMVPSRGMTRHIACTAAAIRYPEAHFELIRLGIGLYGIWPSQAIKNWAKGHRPLIRLKPAMTWKTRLAEVKVVPTGTSIGYGSTVKVKRTTRIGILPVGYFDGYDRGLSNKGWVVIRGQTCRVLGRVCMNLMIIDLTRVAAKTGEIVTLIGPGASAESLSHAAGIIPYELVSRVHPGLPRRLVG